MMLEGCQSRGAEVDVIYLDRLDIAPCKAHRVQDGSGCMVKDGMETVYAEFEKADGLILATPVYYNTVCAQMKLMLDRSYCLARAETLGPGKRRYVTCVKKKKKGVVISVGGSGIHPECVLPVFDIWSSEVNLEIVDSLCVSEGQLKVLPMDHPPTLEAAFQKGADLARMLAQPA